MWPFPLENNQFLLSSETTRFHRMAHLRSAAVNWQGDEEDAPPAQHLESRTTGACVKRSSGSGITTYRGFPALLIPRQVPAVGSRNGTAVHNDESAELLQK